MGYATRFAGTITVTPRLSPGEFAGLRRFADDRHDTDGGPSYYCQWVPTADGAGIEWDGNEKFYEAEAWMRYLINRFLAPAGHVLNGVIQAQGEAAADRWDLVVKDNAVSRVDYDDFTPRSG
jgi:hypothetical protein